MPTKHSVVRQMLDWGWGELSLLEFSFGKCVALDKLILISVPQFFSL